MDMMSVACVKLKTAQYKPQIKALATRFSLKNIGKYISDPFMFITNLKVPKMAQQLQSFTTS